MVLSYLYTHHLLPGNRQVHKTPEGCSCDARVVHIIGVDTNLHAIGMHPTDSNTNFNRGHTEFEALKRLTPNREQHVDHLNEWIAIVFPTPLVARTFRAQGPTTGTRCMVCQKCYIETVKAHSGLLTLCVANGMVPNVVTVRVMTE